MGQTKVNSAMTISLDPSADVLYAKIVDASIARSREAPSDCYVIINEDSEGSIVGVQVLYASDFAKHWERHPDRSLLPPAICAALDEWTHERKDQR